MPAVDTEENQRQVFSVPTALGNRQSRDFHIPTALRFIDIDKRKEAWRRIAPLPPSRLMLYENQIRSPGSFLDENMLARLPCCRLRCADARRNRHPAVTSAA